MTAEELLNAIGQVDDGLIQEAEDYRPAARRGAPAHWRPVLGGLAAACLVIAVLTHLPAMGGMSGGASGDTAGQQSSTAGGAEPEDAGQEQSTAGSAPSNGMPQQGESGGGLDVVRTPEGTYVLTGETAEELPEGSRQLGVLFLEGEDSRDQLYTGRKEYAGCVLWEGPEGRLYIQLPGGGYALARGTE